MSYKESLQRANEYDDDLRADHPRFVNWVVVHHAEGTQMVMASSFIMEDPEDPKFLWVFSEHHRFQVFAKEDITTAVELETVRRFRTAHGFAEDWHRDIVQGD